MAYGKPVPLAEAPSPDEKPDPPQYWTVSGVRCPHCDNVGTYGRFAVAIDRAQSERKRTSCFWQTKRWQKLGSAIIRVDMYPDEVIECID